MSANVVGMPTTQEFIGEVHIAIADTHLPRQRDKRIGAAALVVQAIERRDTYYLTGTPSCDVELTDEQWAELHQVAVLALHSHRAEG